MKAIAFDADSVRAILAGRKTQFRVPVKPQPPHSCTYTINGAGTHALCFGLNRECVPPTGRSVDHRLPCPFGGPGARVWVKETWQEVSDSIYYRATDEQEFGYILHEWRSRLCMPRWASRLTLEIVSVRVERVQEIKCYEIRSEGISCPEHDSPSGFCCSECDALRAAFAARWDTLNAKRGYPWASNPWVWAIEFRTITPTAADAAGEPRHA